MLTILNMSEYSGPFGTLISLKPEQAYRNSKARESVLDFVDKQQYSS